MDDLGLWRRLRSKDAGDAGTLAAALAELARAPFAARWPFLGLLPPLVAHADAAVRAAAVLALKEAHGLPALEAVVTALGDPEPVVRAAAVEALAGATTAHPWRFAHAVFHGSADVRAAALDASVAGDARPLHFYLVEDPALAARVLARVRGREALGPPGEGLAAPLELVGRGVLPPEDARLVLGRSVAQLAAVARAQHGRDAAKLTAALNAVLASPTLPELGRLEPLGEDPLDALVALFDAAPEPEQHAFWTAFGAALHLGDGVLARRLVASLLVCAHARDASAPVATTPFALAAVHVPALLCARWVPLSVRRAALARFAALGRHLAKRDPSLLVPYLFAQPFLDEGGRPALGAVAALLELGTAPWKAALDAISETALLDAAERAPAQAGPLFALADDPSGTRAAVLAKLEARSPLAAVRALAAAVRVAPQVGTVLDKLGGERTVRVVAELLAQTAPPGAALEARHVERILPHVAASLDTAGADALLRAWLVGPAPSEHALGLALAGAMAQKLGADAFASVVRGLPVPQQRRLVAALPFATAFPWAQQLKLAETLSTSPDAELAAWAKETLVPPTERVRPAAVVGRLSPTSAVEIATCAAAHLGRMLDDAARSPHAGVAGALAVRADGSPSVTACLALLRAHDPLADVARELARFSSDGRAELLEAARGLFADEGGAVPPGLAGLAALFRWESHARALLDALEGAGGLPAAVREAAAWRVEPLGAWVLAALAEWARDAGARDREALRARTTPELVAALIGALGAGPLVAHEAARVLAAVHAGRMSDGLLAQVRPAASAVLPELDEKTRDALAPWVSSDGLPAAPPRGQPLLHDEALLAAIRGSASVDWLTTFARAQTRRVVDDAAIRLAELDGGPQRLVALLAESPPPPHAEALADSVALWPDGGALDGAAALALDETRPPAVRFRLALELVARGRHALAEPAARIAAAPHDGRPFVRPRDFERLRAALPLSTLAPALATSGEVHAYRPAVEALLASVEGDTAPSIPEDAALPALRAFLDAGTLRIGELRRRAARALLRTGDASALPIVLADVVRTPARDVLAGLPADVAIAAARALLLGGPRVAPDARVEQWITAPGVAPEVELELAPELLVWARDDKLRERVARRLSRPDRRARKLREVAETFAWGIARGRELTGRLFDVRMIGGKAWGYTRLNTSAVHVTTLPILRQVRWGRQIVEGLILHELGHHLYHRGPGANDVWAEATRAGLHGLLNLVADEHLERNLRAVDAEYGDRLKRLVAHAFQHADKEVPVATLLADLGGRAFSVLTGSPLRLARDDASVSLHNGELLLAMERAGLSFPRFVRSLRMGLGDRHGDPKVQQALALFGTRGFRASTMKELWEIALGLRAIFGWEVKLIERLGAPESLEPGHPDETIHGEGISDADVAGEVERVLDPRGRQGRSGTGPGGKSWINASPDEAFDPIDKVVVVPHDPAAHSVIAKEVARPARAMRALLEQLGLRGVPVRRRLTGRSFDRASARALVLLGDPHVLVARPQQPMSDLFLGLVIDCSGSMAARGNMDRAKRFATLLAEAARGLPGVTLRVFGFTDKVIYEAGTADRCAAHALVASGGNNDAAALWHAMGVARASRRKARMLVMISDGLPTECSVAALKAVVRRGRREGILCAQVAVQPLSEVCFPYYVVVDDADLDAAAKKFGAIASKLVRTALSAG